MIGKGQERNASAARERRRKEGRSDRVPFAVGLFAFASLLFWTGGLRVMATDETSGSVTLVAGGGSLSGAKAEGIPATEARLANPHDLAFDREGNLYLTEFSGNRIRKIARDGILTTVAGGGRTAGVKAEGGPATDARLNGPSSVVFDREGNYYIAEYQGCRVWKVDRTGVITKFAGTGSCGYGGDGGPATAARVNGPTDLALDPEGNLYIADVSNDRVRKVDRAGIITTVAGVGATTPERGENGTKVQLKRPHFLALDREGSLYIAEVSRGLVHRLTPDGAITVFAGGGKSTTIETGIRAADLRLPDAKHVAVDSAGDVFILRHEGGEILKVNSGGVITGVIAIDRVGQSDIGRLHGLTIDGEGNVYYTDYLAHTIHRVAKVAAPGLLMGMPLVPPGPMAGDLDGDRRIGLADVGLLLRAVVGMTPLTPDQTARADADANGRLEMGDVLHLLRRIVGLGP